VTGRKDQAQQVVAHLIVDRRREVGLRTDLPLLELATKMLMFAVLHLAASQMIDGAMFGRRHEPGAGIVRHSGLGPLLQRGDQRVLRQVFCDADITDHPCQTSDESGGFDPPDRIDGVSSLL